jgi:dipeptidyl-peptidase-4
MKQLIFLIVAFLCLSLSFAQNNESTITVEDYQRATEFLRSNTNNLVDNGAVRPTWFEDGRFWYETKVNGNIKICAR